MFDPPAPDSFMDKDGILAEARLLLEEGHFKKVGRWLRNAVCRDSDDIEGMMTLAGVFRKLNRHSEALIVLEALQVFHPDDSSLQQLKDQIIKELDTTTRS